MSTIDPKVPIKVHPELTVEWDSTASYEKTAGYFSDGFQKEAVSTMNSIKHDLKILIRTMIVVASELRHLRHEGIPEPD